MTKEAEYHQEIASESKKCKTESSKTLLKQPIHSKYMSLPAFFTFSQYFFDPFSRVSGFNRGAFQNNVLDSPIQSDETLFVAFAGRILDLVLSRSSLAARSFSTSSSCTPAALSKLFFYYVFLILLNLFLVFTNLDVFAFLIVVILIVAATILTPPSPQTSVLLIMSIIVMMLVKGTTRVSVNVAILFSSYSRHSAVAMLKKKKLRLAATSYTEDTMLCDDEGYQQ
ncbi:hypothetical protein PsorP6_006068 [Peronosclerospora sorghi]|uniref:Uncharacterized protein n=1 Tax=Peronosclerospora sorghi TaxID=230839 RepID=A0ACC0W1H0_9STRA|nr:hypothetical protein PsorP6_006068 [Peronosclerospora sorghi]